MSPEKARILFLFFFWGFLFWNPRREKKGSMGEGGSVVHQRRISGVRQYDFFEWRQSLPQSGEVSQRGSQTMRNDVHTRFPLKK